MEVTKVLLEHGSQVDPVDSDGCTPLHKAVERGDAETYKLLVSIIPQYIGLVLCQLFTIPQNCDIFKNRVYDLNKCLTSKRLRSIN